MGVRSFWFFSHESQLTLFSRIKHPPSQTSTTQHNTKAWNKKRTKRLSKMRNIIQKKTWQRFILKICFPLEAFHMQPINPYWSPRWKTTKKKCISASRNLEKSSVLFLQNLNHLKPHNTQNLHLPNFVTFKILNNLHHPPITDSYS